jgi:hypothetical protein
MKIWQEGEIFLAEGEDKDFGCCECSSIIQKREDGFHCHTNKRKDKDTIYRIFCEACQNKWNKEKISDKKFCHLLQLGNEEEHCHTKFTRK